MIATARTLIQLRWALTWAILRKSTLQTIGYIIASLMALGAMVGTAALAFQVGGEFHAAIPADLLERVYGSDGVIRSLVVIGGTSLTLFIAMIQLMLIGEGSTMSSRRFALYGIEDRRLQFGLLASGLSGLPAITGVVCMLAWAMAYRPMGSAAVVAELVAAPLIIVTMMSIAKLIISLSTTLVTSKRGKSVFYIVTVLVFVTICQIPSILLNNGFDPGNGFGSGINLDLRQLAPFAAVAAWTPLGAGFQLPFDAMAGDWLPLAAHVAILTATWAVCFLGCTWCLKRERLTLGAGGPAVRIKGVGAFRSMPDSVSGAVSARLVTYLRRDPRLAMMFAMPAFFAVIFGLQSHDINVMVWQSLIWGGWMFSIVESNGLSYDGRGFTMQAISGVRGLDDRIGRVRVYAGIIVVYLAVLAVAIGLYTGDWFTPSGALTGLVFLALGYDAAFCSLGLAEVVSCVFMYPVPSMDKPFSSPQGRAMAQGFFPFIYMLGSLLLVLPTGIAAVALALTGVWDTAYWLLIPIALVNGAAALAIGSWLGGKLMDARMLSIVKTLDSFASLQK